MARAGALTVATAAMEAWARARVTSTTSTLYIGALQLDFYEVPKKQTVFRAVATKTLDAKAKPEKRQKNLTKAVAKMLKKYPPQPE